jgi:hypothetical protein
MSNELIARLEAATADHQRELLFEAFEAVHPYPGHEHYLVDEIDWTWDRLRQPFIAMLDAEAYESAALTLVPEGWNWGIFMRHDWPKQNAQVWHREREASTKHGEAATPALAIAAATLRAKDTTHD